MAIENETLLTLTADIVSAHMSNNTVATGDIGPLIQKVHAALQAIDAPQETEMAPVKPTGAVSLRASIRPQHLVSMIDGKSYKMLKRHLSLNGYTPETYREAFDLPRDYPMVAAEYAEKRRALAHKIGLGRKPTGTGSGPSKKAAKVSRRPSPPKTRPTA